MRTLCLQMFVPLAVLLAPHAACRAEFMTRHWERDRRILECWRFSHFKYLDMMGISSWGNSNSSVCAPGLFMSDQGECFSGPAIVDNKKLSGVLKKLHAELIESRTLVTRAREARMPTWHGSTSWTITLRARISRSPYQTEPAFIVEPSLWYFDPNSEVYRTNFRAWMNAFPETLAALEVTRFPTNARTFIEFMFDYDSFCRDSIPLNSD